MKRCIVKTSTLFGPFACGCEGIMYDRARKGWLCRDHTQERLCEFCQAERAWVRRCYLYQGVACDAWLCRSCAGVRGQAAITRPINKPGTV
jgi:hypothetical protein